MINGQKVWTSGAHRADYGIIVARTDPTQPKHKGLTMFIINMRAPGVEVRPIKQMAGASEFNEVFFTDVRIADDHRLGDVGDGWRVSLTTLMNERLAVGGKPTNSPDAHSLIELARAIDAEEGNMLEQSHVRQKIADVYIQDRGISLTRMRTMSAISSGRTPGPGSSISKVVVAKLMQDMGSFAGDMAESAGLLVGEDASSASRCVEAGLFLVCRASYRWRTDEILRNIIAERVLGAQGISARTRAFHSMNCTRSSAEAAIADSTILVALTKQERQKA